MRRRTLFTAAAIAVTAVTCRAYVRVTWPGCLLGWVAFVPWLFAIGDDRTARDAWRSGVVMSVAYTVAVFDWFAVAVHGYTGYPMWSMFLLLAASAPLLQPQIVAWAVARRRLRGVGDTHPGRRAIGAAAAYVGTEWLASGKLFGDTWGHGMYAAPLWRQAADVGGAPGLTFALVLVNEWVATAVREARTPSHRSAAGSALAWSAALVAGLALYGHLRLARVDPAAPPLATAGLVQASLGDYGTLREAEGTYGAVRVILDTHMALSRTALAAAPLDLLVWPETAYPTTFGTPKSPDGADFDREISAFVRDSGVPMALGTYDAADGAEYNAAAFLLPTAPGDGRVDTYRKTQLFPLVERVPRWLDGAWTRAALPWLGTWTPGAGPRLVTLPRRDGRPIRWAPMICYDAVEPTHALDAARAGADAFVTLSNDGWFEASEGAHLHFVVAAFRSIETARAQVRATNSGISAIIGPTGDLLADAGVGERTTLEAAIPAPLPGMTLAVRLGDWVGPVAVAIAALTLFAASRD